MRVMVIVKASKESEAGVLPDTEILTQDGEVQRAVGEGWGHAGRRRVASDFERPSG